MTIQALHINFQRIMIILITSYNFGKTTNGIVPAINYNKISMLVIASYTKHYFSFCTRVRGNAKVYS